MFSECAINATELKIDMYICRACDCFPERECFAEYEMTEARMVSPRVSSSSSSSRRFQNRRQQLEDGDDNDES